MNQGQVPLDPLILKRLEEEAQQLSLDFEKLTDRLSDRLSQVCIYKYLEFEADCPWFSCFSNARHSAGWKYLELQMDARVLSNIFSVCHEQL